MNETKCNDYWSCQASGQILRDIIERDMYCMGCLQVSLEHFMRQLCYHLIFIASSIASERIKIPPILCWDTTCYICLVNIRVFETFSNWHLAKKVVKSRWILGRSWYQRCFKSTRYLVAHEKWIDLISHSVVKKQLYVVLCQLMTMGDYFCVSAWEGYHITKCLIVSLPPAAWY